MGVAMEVAGKFTEEQEKCLPDCEFSTFLGSYWAELSQRSQFRPRSEDLQNILGKILSLS